MDKKVNKIVLAYSGGLDTSVILKWLLEEYDCPVVTYTADLGQGEDLSGVESRALEVGAQKSYVLDLREEFISEFVFPMLRANAVYQGYYLLGTSIARPLIAQKQRYSGGGKSRRRLPWGNGQGERPGEIRAHLLHHRPLHNRYRPLAGVETRL